MSTKELTQRKLLLKEYRERAKKKKAPWPEGDYSEAQIKRAQQISNNISEDMAGGEARGDLYMAISYWCDVACEEAGKRAALESRLQFIQLAEKIKEATLKDYDKPRAQKPSKLRLLRLQALKERNRETRL